MLYVLEYMFLMIRTGENLPLKYKNYQSNNQHLMALKVLIVIPLNYFGNSYTSTANFDLF